MSSSEAATSILRSRYMGSLAIFTQTQTLYPHHASATQVSRHLRTCPWLWVRVSCRCCRHSVKLADQDFPLNRCMGLSQSYGPADDNVSKVTLKKALDIGCTFWDSAVVYGKGHNEKLLGDFFKENNARDKVFIASKCGFDVSIF